MESSNIFYKNNPGDRVYWVEDLNTIGVWRFSFDREKIYYFFRDYPQALTPEELAIFNAENPELAQRFGNN